MKSEKPNDAHLTGYLLGELPEEECMRLEQDCLDDNEIFEQLKAIQTELIDDYVHGVLRGRRREEFEKRILNAPSGQEQLELAKLIAESQVRRRPSFPLRLKSWIIGEGSSLPLLRIAAVMATLAVAVGIGWFSVKRWSSSSPQQQIAKRGPTAAEAGIPPPNAVVTTREAPQKPSTEVPARGPARTAAIRPLIATFSLASGGVRGEGDANEIRIASNVKRVRFKIERPSSDYETYEAALNRVEGERLFVQSRVRARLVKHGAMLFVEMPASVLPAGTSVLTLKSIAKAGEGTAHDLGPTAWKYVLRVQRQ